MELKFFKCKHCGQIVYKVKNTEVPLICCGEIMQELVAGIEDASHEKHVPCHEVSGGVLKVNVGAVEHPMLAEHYIEWVAVRTNKTIYLTNLNPTEKPYAEFVLKENEEVEEVFAYCNLHGLWKA